MMDLSEIILERHGKTIFQVILPSACNVTDRDRYSTKSRQSDRSLLSSRTQLLDPLHFQMLTCSELSEREIKPAGFLGEGDTLH